MTYLHPAWYARQGYLVVVQDVRGRYASEGVFLPFVHEAEDGYDTVEWAAALPGSNGKVGMYGFSYAGYTQLAAAVLNPPHLATIVPAFTAPDLYRHWFYPGGVLNLAFVLSWSLHLAREEARRRGDIDRFQALNRQSHELAAAMDHRPLDTFPQLNDAGVADFYQEWILHDRRDDYWTSAQMDITGSLDEIRVPVLYMGGLYDIFAQGAYETASLLTKQHVANRVLLGPWQHMPWSPSVGDLDFQEEAVARLDEAQLNWFAHWLKDDATLPLPQHRVFVMGANRWRALTAWPPETRFWRLYLHSAGNANTRWGNGTLDENPPEREPADFLVHDPFMPVVVDGGHSCCDDALAPMGPRDQRPAETQQGMLVFTSQAVAKPQLWSGQPKVRLHVRSEAEDVHLHCALCWVRADGSSINLTEGAQRLGLTDDQTQYRPLAPQACHVVELTLGPVSLEASPGDRLRLDVSLSRFPASVVSPSTAGNPGLVPPTRAYMAMACLLHDQAAESYVDLPVEEVVDGLDRSDPIRGVIRQV